MLKNVYTVKQVNAYIKNMFTQDFMLNRLYVKGEVSNCKYHPSGHIYFSLKDESGTIACVMFAGSRSGLSFRMQEGQQVVVLGSVSVYERDGRYQMYAREIILDGAGELYLKFEALKKELEEMGMFAQEYKRPIPQFVKKVGIVTASSGAAVRDIINIAARRNPYVQLILCPAKVQGEGAAESIVQGIRMLEEQDVDVMIVGRGGGSIEDLWAFNEEIVARAIFESRVPVISAVGHETDRGLCGGSSGSDSFGGCRACGVRISGCRESDEGISDAFEQCGFEKGGTEPSVFETGGTETAAVSPKAEAP